MTVDFLEFLKKSKGKFAFVATYEFDPQFFERRVLCTPAFEGASIVIFVDEERYHDILATGRQSQGFDRNYFVIPISRAGGVFHPKLYLAIGEKGTIASVGSNNCTSAGTGHNFELISTVEMSSGEEGGANALLIASVFRQFQRYAQEAGAISEWLERDIFDHAMAAFPWLAESDDGGEDIELLSSHDNHLLPQIVARLAGKDIRKIVLLAPFFDKNLSMVERVNALWPNAAIQIISQSGYSNLPIERFVELRDKLGNIELVTATSQKAGRKMHAKVLAFEAQECTYWLAGSANMSNAAIAGGNSEACLWFATKQTVAQALKQDELSFSPIDPEDFEAAAINEPCPPEDETHGLKLQSLILTEEGKILVSAVIPEQITDITLRIFKPLEALPTFSWKIGSPKSEFTLSLTTDDQLKFDRPAVGCLQGFIDGSEIATPLCSVKQLTRLLRDRTGSSAAGNRLDRVMESGDGLVEYIDALDGINAAIDFMNNTTIRFKDDTHSGGGGGGGWRPRDPFSGDVPDHWSIGSSGGSIIELREAIWAFVQRHIDTRLKRHLKRGNLGGLQNFLDIYRTISRVLLAWNNRRINDEIVIPTPYVTRGLQDILATLIGTRSSEGQSESLGFVRVILNSLKADEVLVRKELDRNRISPIICASVDEMIRARALFLRRSGDDEWSQTRRDWVTNWIDEIGLSQPNKIELEEICKELRLAA